MLYVLALQPGLYGAVLVVELGEIRHEVPDHIEMWQRIDAAASGLVLVDGRHTRQRIGAIDVHGTGPADTFAARAPESQSGIKVRLDLDEGIQNHGAALFQIELVGLGLGLIARLPPIDLEGLHARRLGGRWWGWWRCWFSSGWGGCAGRISLTLSTTVSSTGFGGGRGASSSSSRLGGGRGAAISSVRFGGGWGAAGSPTRYCSLGWWCISSG